MSVGETLTPDEAVERLESDPESLWWGTSDFSLQFGITLEEIRAEAAAGRLQIKGIPDGRGGWRDCIITAGSYLRWRVNRRTPERLLRKVRGHLQGPTQ